MTDDEAVAVLTSLPEISIRHLLPDDVLILEFDLVVSARLSDQLKEAIERLFPNRKVAVLGRETRLKIVSEQDG